MLLRPLNCCKYDHDLMEIGLEMEVFLTIVPKREKRTRVSADMVPEPFVLAVLCKDRKFISEVVIDRPSGGINA
jgi:hypothetical protein